MDTITVGVRVRPLIKGESGEIKWSVHEKSVKLIENHSTLYEFDNVFDHNVETETIFKELADPVVRDAVRGINGTIFAYGQTASGKTYTMMGDDKSLGIIPLAVLELFNIIKKKNDRDFIVRVSYFELYNETITDLQDTSRTNLQLREGPGRLFVHNLSETECCCVTDVLTVLVAGRDNRTVRETKMNTASSRSHAIFTIIIESRNKCETDQDIVQVSCLNLVDLAGSEKASAAVNQAEFNEGKHINLSLMTLSNVISKLSLKYDGHIQYRDSKLTRYLQHSLGGNSKTVIICNISPHVLEESHSTLKFAQRAKKISNKPVVNEVFLSESAMMKKMSSMVEEIKTLKEELKKYKEDTTTDKTNSESSYSNDSLNKQLIIDSPLFNRRKTFIVNKTDTPNSTPTSSSRGGTPHCRSFLPPNVTMRRKKIPSSPDASHGRLFCDFPVDVAVQTDVMVPVDATLPMDTFCTTTPTCPMDATRVMDTTSVIDATLTNTTHAVPPMDATCTMDATVAVDPMSGCAFSHLDQSFHCEHLTQLKSVSSLMEELQFQYDEHIISCKENESVLLTKIDDLKSELSVSVNIEKYNEKCKELEEVLEREEELNNNIQVLREELIELEQKRKAQEMILKRTETEISTLTSSIERLNTNEDVMSRRNEELENENEKLRETIKLMIQDIDKYKQHQAEMNALISQYESKAAPPPPDQCSVSTQTLKRELVDTELKDTIDHMNEQLSESINRTEGLEAVVAEKECNIAALLADNKRLLQRNSELINDRVPKELFIENERSCLRLKDEVFQLKKKIEKLNNDVGRYRKERDIFRAKYDMLKEQRTITPSSVPHTQEPHTPTILESSRFSYNVKKPTTTSGQPLQPPPTLPPSSKLQSSSSLAPVEPVKPVKPVTGTGTGSGVAYRKENEDPDPDTLYEYTVDEETGDYIIIPPKRPIKLPDENCKQQ